MDILRYTYHVIQAPDVKPVEPELVKELSQPGNICIYHVDIGSDTAKNVTQTDIAIQSNNNIPS